MGTRPSPVKSPSLGVSAVLLGENSQHGQFAGQHPTRAEFVRSQPSSASWYGWGTGQRGSQGWDKSSWGTWGQAKVTQRLCSKCAALPPCPAPWPHSSGDSWGEPRPCPAIRPDPATPSPCVSSLLSPPVSLPSPSLPLVSAGSSGPAPSQCMHGGCPHAGWWCVCGGGAGVIIIFVFFALPWKYIVFSANPVQLHHNKTHNKNVIHFSRALHLPVSWQAIKNLSSFFWQEPCTFSSLIYESRIATDKPLLRGEGLHYL